MTDEQQTIGYILPPSVVTRADVSRLAIELEHVDADINSARLRGQNSTMPSLTPALHDFVATNNLSLDDEKVRTTTIAELRHIKDAAPVIHMTFASPADGESLTQLVQWFRESVDPRIVIATSLQPSLIAGVYVRTPNHVHDLSLKGTLHAGHDVLIKHIEELRRG